MQQALPKKIQSKEYVRGIEIKNFQKFQVIFLLSLENKDYIASKYLSKSKIIYPSYYERKI